MRVASLSLRSSNTPSKEFVLAHSPNLRQLPLPPLSDTFCLFLFHLAYNLVRWENPMRKAAVSCEFPAPFQRSLAATSREFATCSSENWLEISLTPDMVDPEYPLKEFVGVFIGFYNHRQKRVVETPRTSHEGSRNALRAPPEPSKAKIKGLKKKNCGSLLWGYKKTIFRTLLEGPAGTSPGLPPPLGRLEGTAPPQDRKGS